MPQHFLLSAAARTLKLRDVYRMSDDEAFGAFTGIRFAENGGEAFCPFCGCTDPYVIATRRKWKCRACGKQFSTTSGHLRLAQDGLRRSARSDLHLVQLSYG